MKLNLPTTIYQLRSVNCSGNWRSIQKRPRDISARLLRRLFRRKTSKNALYMVNNIKTSQLSTIGNISSLQTNRILIPLLVLKATFFESVGIEQTLKIFNNGPRELVSSYVLQHGLIGMQRRINLSFIMTKMTQLLSLRDLQSQGGGNMRKRVSINNGYLSGKHQLVIRQSLSQRGIIWPKNTIVSGYFLFTSKLFLKHEWRMDGQILGFFKRMVTLLMGIGNEALQHR